MALQWLKKSETKSNDDIFRKFLAITQNNKLVNKNQEEIEFAELQNKDGGFGISKDYKSDVFRYYSCSGVYGEKQKKIIVKK